MLRIFTLFTLCLLLTFCATSLNLKPRLVYTTTNLNYDQLSKKYQNVNIHQGTDLQRFIENVFKVEDPLLLNNYGTTKFQVFVDKDGSIESVICFQAFKEDIDSLVLSYLLKTKFRKLYYQNKPTTYSVIFSYEYSGSKTSYPRINQASIRQEFYPGESIVWGKLVEPESVDELPKVLVQPPPFYPDIARKIGVEGRVIVTIEIDQKGNVTNAKIFKGERILGKECIENAYKYKFKPAIKDGKPIKVKMNVPFNFRLH